MNSRRLASTWLALVLVSAASSSAQLITYQIGLEAAADVPEIDVIAGDAFELTFTVNLGAATTPLSDTFMATEAIALLSVSVVRGAQNVGLLDLGATVFTGTNVLAQSGATEDWLAFGFEGAVPALGATGLFSIQFSSAVSLGVVSPWTDGASLGELLWQVNGDDFDTFSAVVLFNTEFGSIAPPLLVSSVSVIPEPSTYALALGLLGLLAVQGRRRRRGASR